MDPMSMMQMIVYGAGSGIVAAFGGWAKTRAKGPGEGFDNQKFVITVILGAVIGGIGAVRGWDYSQAYVWLANIGGVVMVEHFGKAVWRSYMNMPAKPAKKEKPKKKTNKKDEKPEKAEKKDEKADEKDEKPADDSEE